MGFKDDIGYQISGDEEKRDPRTQTGVSVPLT
jgi:hypothetical protein